LSRSIHFLRFAYFRAKRLMTAPSAKPADVHVMRITAKNPQVAGPWWAGESPVRLSDLPRLLPPLPSGARTSIKSIYRWSTRGLGGVRLRRFKHGGGWATTAEELLRFQQARTLGAA